MARLRQLLSTSILCTILFACCASAQSTLTQIQDTVYNPDGTPFNGTVVITWTGTSSPGGSSPTPYGTSVQIFNGALSVFLSPSTSAVPAAYYIAVFNSSNGLISWSETWQVPPSVTPVTLAEVREATSGSGSGGATIPMSEVIGLTAYLNSITGSLTTLTTTVNDLNTTVNSLGSQVTTLTNLVNNIGTTGSTPASPLFVDAEIPGGAINGTNTTFTLANTPYSTGSLSLFRNGLLQLNGVDFTLSGNTITFDSGSVPQGSDLLQAYYRIPGNGPAAVYADDETPAGNINGSNLTFTLAAAPSPAFSLRLYKNGVLLLQNTDYTLTGSTIAFVNTAITPQSGDSLTAYYRH